MNRLKSSDTSALIPAGEEIAEPIRTEKKRFYK